jgi:DNA-binding MarR family transcriptional regulator
VTVATPEELLTTLRRFGLENDRLDATVARRLGAPPVEFKAMDHLHEARELTPGQLADRLCLTSGAVTALIDRLERLGWAERAPHPSDRRSVIVRPSAPAGKSEAVEIYMDYARRMERLARRMTAAQRAAAIEFLEAAGRVAAERADALRHPERADAPRPLELNAERG